MRSARAEPFAPLVRPALPPTEARSPAGLLLARARAVSYSWAWKSWVAASTSRAEREGVFPVSDQRTAVRSRISVSPGRVVTAASLGPLTRRCARRLHRSLPRLRRHQETIVSVKRYKSCEVRRNGRALYEELRQARSDAMHQGAHARILTDHAVELTIILEDALMPEASKTEFPRYCWCHACRLPGVTPSWASSNQQDLTPLLRSFTAHQASSTGRLSPFCISKIEV
jgi:hypothetical protein